MSVNIDSLPKDWDGFSFIISHVKIVCVTLTKPDVDPGDVGIEFEVLDGPMAGLVIRKHFDYNDSGILDLS